MVALIWLWRTHLRGAHPIKTWCRVALPTWEWMYFSPSAIWIKTSLNQHNFGSNNKKQQPLFCILSVNVLESTKNFTCFEAHHECFINVYIYIFTKYNWACTKRSSNCEGRMLFLTRGPYALLRFPQFCLREILVFGYAYAVLTRSLWIRFCAQTCSGSLRTRFFR